jgi:hypothetical protein
LSRGGGAIGGEVGAGKPFGSRARAVAGAGVVTAVAMEVGGSPSRDRRQIEVGEEPGPGGDHIGDGVDAVQRGGHDAGVPLEAGGDRLGVELLERHERAGVAGDLDLEALAARPEGPRWVEVLLAHQPVDRGGDDRLAVDQAFPSEPLRGHEPGRDRADGRVDGRGGDGDVVGGAQVGIEAAGGPCRRGGWAGRYPVCGTVDARFSTAVMTPSAESRRIIRRCSAVNCNPVVPNLLGSPTTQSSAHRGIAQTPLNPPGQPSAVVDSPRLPGPGRG